MKRREQLLATALVVGAFGASGGYGVFAAFSATTSNSANTISAGTVKLEDNDLGATLYNLANVKPSDPSERCIKVTYNGSLDSDVKLYTQTPSLDGLAKFIDLEITPGTQPGSTFPDCAGFVADGGPLYTGTLSGFRDTHNTYATALSAFPAGKTKWTTGDTVVFKVRVNVQDTDDAQGLSSGSHEFRWEARN